MTHTKRLYEDYCTERFPTIELDQITALESRLSINLPEYYRDYLLKYNGGKFSEPLIHHDKPEFGDDCLLAMYGIGAPHPTYELGRPLDIAIVSDENNPIAVLSIGTTMRNQYIVLILEEGAEDQFAIQLKFFRGWSFLGWDLEEFLSLVWKE